MSEHDKKAVTLYENSCNCAQAVLCAFCDATGLEEEPAMKLASSFGGGMGKMREVCGAMTGLFMTAGLCRGYGAGADKKAKEAHDQLVQSLAQRFREQFGSIQCRELLPAAESRAENDPSANQTRPCGAYVAFAAALMDELLQA